MNGISLLLVEVLISGVIIAVAVREVIVTRRLLRDRDAEGRTDDETGSADRD